MKKRSWPSWWDWELEFTPHLYKRMDDRDFNELDLRTMLERVHAYREDVIEGRWIIETRYRKRTWEIIVEPEMGWKLLVVITAYPVWRI